MSWVDTGNVLSERLQAQKATSYMIPLLQNTHSSKIQRDTKWLSVCQGPGAVTAHGDRSPSGEMRRFWHQIEVAVAQHGECAQRP